MSSDRWKIWPALILFVGLGGTCSAAVVSVPDETTIADMYLMCDALLSGNFSSNLYPDVCRLNFLDAGFNRDYLSKTKTKGCPPPNLSPERKAYAFVTKYLETRNAMPDLGQRLKFDLTRPWQPWAADAIASKWAWRCY